MFSIVIGVMSFASPTSATGCTTATPIAVLARAPQQRRQPGSDVGIAAPPAHELAVELLVTPLARRVGMGEVASTPPRMTYPLDLLTSEKS